MKQNYALRTMTSSLHSVPFFFDHAARVITTVAVIECATIVIVKQRDQKVFFYLDAAWLNEGRCPGGRSSVSVHKE